MATTRTRLVRATSRWSNATVNKHANLMAYNDVAFILIPVLLASLALIFLLPKHGYVEDWPQEQSH
jgi:hypothetical protein